MFNEKTVYSTNFYKEETKLSSYFFYIWEGMILKIFISHPKDSNFLPITDCLNLFKFFE